MNGAPSLHSQLSNWCVHFNCMMHQYCDAGIAYEDVRDPHTTPYSYPCFKDNNCAERCAHAQYPTEQEIIKQEQEIHQKVSTFLSNLACGLCPVCEQPIQYKESIGLSQYAYPCGHRLGTVLKEKE